MRRLLLLPLLVFALTAASSATAASSHTVSITKAGFVPATLTIPNGDSVTWKNNDTTNHQIVSDNGSFSTTRVLAPGESATRTFPDAGTFPYHDASNAALKGTVNVQEVRSISLQPVGAQKVMFTHALTLKGQVSKRNSNGEEVLVQARPYSETDFQTTPELWNLRRSRLSLIVVVARPGEMQDSVRSPAGAAKFWSIGCENEFRRSRSTAISGWK